MKKFKYIYVSAEDISANTIDVNKLNVENISNVSKIDFQSGGKIVSGS